MSEIDPIYKEVAAKIGPGQPGAVSGAESKYLAQLIAMAATPQQARIMRELPDPDREKGERNLEVSEAFAKRLGLDKETIQKDLHDLFLKGYVFPTSRGPQLGRNLMLLHDAIGMIHPECEYLGLEYKKLLHKLHEEEIIPMRAANREIWGRRIIPRWRAIKDIPGVLPYEDMREIIRQQELLAVAICPCKDIHWDRTCGIPRQTCLVFNQVARYNIQRGTAKRMSVKEMMDFLVEMDKWPIVPMSQNSDRIDRQICLCHYDCCGYLGTDWYGAPKDDIDKVKEKLAKTTIPSRFQAEVNPEKCLGCKTCLGMCQFGAAQVRYYPEYGEERAYIDTERCKGCGSCVVNCPIGARKLKLVRPVEHIPTGEETIFEKFQKTSKS